MKNPRRWGFGWERSDSFRNWVKYLCGRDEVTVVSHTTQDQHRTIRKNRRGVRRACIE